MELEAEATLVATLVADLEGTLVELLAAVPLVALAVLPLPL